MDTFGTERDAPVLKEDLYAMLIRGQEDELAQITGDKFGELGR